MSRLPYVDKDLRWPSVGACIPLSAYGQIMLTAKGAAGRLEIEDSGQLTDMPYGEHFDLTLDEP